jgi:ribbon-helix-helix CopG family protein
MKEDQKVLTVRVDAAQAREAEVVARAEGVSVNELVRQALAAHIETRRKDKAFRARIAGIIEEDKAILERLAQ